MTDMVVLLLALAIASWVLRIALIVLIPASRLPDVVRSSLDHLATRRGSPRFSLVLDLAGSLSATANAMDAMATAGAAEVIASVAWRTRNLAITASVAWTR